MPERILAGFAGIRRSSDALSLPLEHFDGTAAHDTREDQPLPGMAGNRHWSPSFQQVLRTAGIRMVHTPFQAPHANAYAERFVRSIKDECHGVFR